MLTLKQVIKKVGKENFSTQVIQDGIEWDFMWAKLGIDSLNVGLEHPSGGSRRRMDECWQYMDTSFYNGILSHYFRHRLHPISHKKEVRIISVSDNFEKEFNSNNDFE